MAPIFRKCLLRQWVFHQVNTGRGRKNDFYWPLLLIFFRYKRITAKKFVLQLEIRSVLDILIAFDRKTNRFARNRLHVFNQLLSVRVDAMFFGKLWFAAKIGIEVEMNDPVVQT